MSRHSKSSVSHPTDLPSTHHQTRSSHSSFSGDTTALSSQAPSQPLHPHAVHSHPPHPSHTHAHDSHEQSDNDEEELSVSRNNNETPTHGASPQQQNTRQQRGGATSSVPYPSATTSSRANNNNNTASADADDVSITSDLVVGNDGDADVDGDGVDIDSLDDSEEGSDSYGSEDDYAWIPWFCALKGNEFFCEVEEEFAQDAFNLTGLEQLVPYFDQALDMILDVEPAEVMTEEAQEVIENDAENLFGLIHARYIITSRGLQAMLEKYRLFHFGRCARVLCRGQAVLPVGLSDTPNEDNVKLYCPRCEDVYNTKSPRHEHIDGAYFGTTFAHLFFLTFPELKVSKSKEMYVPRVFGFKIHKSAYKKSLEMRKKEKEKEKRKRNEQQQQQSGTTAGGIASITHNPSQ